MCNQDDEMSLVNSGRVECGRMKDGTQNRPTIAIYIHRLSS